jgi:hypothetical protein
MSRTAAGGVAGRDEAPPGRAAGLTDVELAETIAHVALNVLTNYFDKAADADVDLPVVAA